MLFLRAGGIPEKTLFLSHIYAFSLIFAVSVLIFFIAGLYEKHTVILKSRLPHIIFRAELINSVIAVLFFYFVPYFGISPKVNLFIYVAISFILIIIWRVNLASFFITKKPERAILIGSGKEMEELFEEVNKNIHYGLFFVKSIDLEDVSPINFENDIMKMVEDENVSLLVIDLEHDKVRPILSKLYYLIFFKVHFISMYKVYEDVFKRVPFSILHYDWFLENISASPKAFYDILKRITDIALSIIGGTLSLVVYPFVFMAIKFEDNGPVFIVQERIGKGGKKIKILKFRSMKSNDSGVWPTENDERITVVGKFLRKSRIDELPQFWNVLKGDVSLIGPRPDIYALGIELSATIPYYTVRNTIKPGLSGWAQVSQELPPHTLEETKIRLAYDIYYVKNRSFVLDVKIILKTIRTLLSRSGK
jgi:exopolysaccharide biosynthesis polyprenyl glycosylphosphotransferase